MFTKLSGRHFASRKFSFPFKVIALFSIETYTSGNEASGLYGTAHEESCIKILLAMYFYLFKANAIGST